MELFELGQVLKLARIQRSLTQHELATRTGMSLSSISGLERGALSEIGFVKLAQLFAAVDLELRPLTIGQRRTLDDVLRENVQKNDAMRYEKIKAEDLLIKGNEEVNIARKPEQSAMPETARQRVRHTKAGDRK